MGLARVLRESLGKLMTAPSLILWVFFLMLLMAIPASLAMRDLISDSIGDSLARQELRQGFDLDWWGEFLYQQGGGFANSFGPDVTGGLPVVANLELFLDGELILARVPVLFSGLLFLLIWIFFQGGIVDRYAFPDEAHSRERLFARSGRNFYRMIRLALVAAAGYLAIFGLLGSRLQGWKSRFFADSTAEGPVILATVVVYFLLFLLWWFFSLGMDYAKVALIVERRRSALFSVLRGFGFLFSNLGKCLGLALIALILTLLVGAIYFVFAPGPGQATWQTLGLAFLCGQLYLLARISSRLFAIATQTTFFTNVDVPLPQPHYLESDPAEEHRQAPPALPVRAEVVPEEEEAESDAESEEEKPSGERPA